MLNPNEELPNPHYTGEVYITVCVSYESYEYDCKASLEADTLYLVQKAIASVPNSSAVLEDSDLIDVSEPEGFMEEADRKYEALNDK